jgi:hypothetical protein
MAKELIADESYKLILLDELNIVLRYDYLPLDEVLEVLKHKPRDTHVIVTGRNAKDEVIELADLVTEMTEIKHPLPLRREGPGGDRVLAGRPPREPQPATPASAYRISGWRGCGCSSSGRAS